MLAHATGGETVILQDKTKSNTTKTRTKKTHITQNQHTEKTKARFSHLLRHPAWKRSETIMVQWEGSKKIDEASKKVKDTERQSRRWESEGIRGIAPGPHGAPETYRPICPPSPCPFVLPSASLYL